MAAHMSKCHRKGKLTKTPSKYWNLGQFFRLKKKLAQRSKRYTYKETTLENTNKNKLRLIARNVSGLMNLLSVMQKEI